METLNNKSVCKSNFKMHCFVCNSIINKGDEITQCLETGGMELRKVPYTGSRWVHMYCLPKDGITKYFLDVAEELHEYYPDEEFSDICEMVENHDYWTREEDNLPGISIPPYHPPTPPHPASNDHVDSDDEEEEELVVNGIFGPLKVNPIEKAEFEKTVDETLEMLNERDKERLVRVNSPIPYQRSVCGTDQPVPEYLKRLFDTPRRVLELERQKRGII